MARPSFGAAHAQLARLRGKVHVLHAAAYLTHPAGVPVCAGDEDYRAHGGV